jgi:hypothetical protein
MTFRKFHSKELGREIQYRVGQPMGMYSSWPAMAFSHHLLVQLAFTIAYPLRTDYFVDYALLGDDLVIRDRAVSEAYKEVIASLGMPYAPSKSFESEGCAEFAKSLFKDGEDLTPLPINLLKFESSTLCGDSMALVKVLSNRQFSIDITDFLRLYASRQRRLITCVILSPKSVRSCFGPMFQHVPINRYNILESIILSQRVEYFVSKLYEQTHA